MILIDGLLTSKKVCTQLSIQLQELKLTPRLAIVMVGNSPASKIYVNSKIKKCQKIGIDAKLYHLQDTISEHELLTQISTLGSDNKVNGLMVQLPLPTHINERLILNCIPTNKDVDGMSANNLGNLYSGSPNGIVPATPLGIIMLLNEYNIKTQGKHCVIIGRSNIVGRPLSILLSTNPYNATVTLCHSHTNNLTAICQQADILIGAIGKPLFIKKEMIKKGAVLIDVGINRIYEEGEKKIVGDIDFEATKTECYAITPVPGGVGPMTIAALMYNIIKVIQLKEE